MLDAMNSVLVPVPSHDERISHIDTRQAARPRCSSARRSDARHRLRPIASPAPASPVILTLPAVRAAGLHDDDEDTMSSLPISHTVSTVARHVLVTMTCVSIGQAITKASPWRRALFLKPARSLGRERIGT